MLSLPTKIDLFNHVKAHLLTQNAQAMDDGGTCLYRAPNGLKCAVGCLIEDKHYDPRFEGSNATRTLHAIVASIGRNLSKDELRMLIELQSIHDERDPEEWPLLLKTFDLS